MEFLKFADGQVTLHGVILATTLWDEVNQFWTVIFHFPSKEKAVLLPKESDLQLCVMVKLSEFLNSIGAWHEKFEAEPCTVLTKSWNRIKDRHEYELHDANYRICDNSFETKDQLIVNCRALLVLTSPRSWNPQESGLGDPSD